VRAPPPGAWRVTVEIVANRGKFKPALTSRTFDNRPGLYNNTPPSAVSRRSGPGRSTHRRPAPRPSAGQAVGTDPTVAVGSGRRLPRCHNSRCSRDRVGRADAGNPLNLPANDTPARASPGAG